MEFISEDVATQVDPSESQLRTYLREHPDKFLVEQRFSFIQVYLNPDRHGNHVTHDAQQLLAKLDPAGRKVNISDLGDPFLLDPNCDDVSSSDVAKDFGANFAASLQKLPVGKWQGPVESGLGMHLVYVSKRSLGRIPELDDVREAVRREWANDYRLEANEKFYEGLLKRYTVTVEQPQPPAEEKSEIGTDRP